MRYDHDNAADERPFDVHALKETAVLVLRAPRHHPKVSAVVFCVVAALGALAAWQARATYESSATLLLARNVTLPTFGDANRARTPSESDPAEGVSEAVKGRDNLISLVRQTHLVDRMAPPRPGEKALTEEEKVLVTAKVLESHIAVKSDGTTVTFVADWGDPKTAYELVSGALHNFLESRHAVEVSIVMDAIALLEEHAKVDREGIDVAMDEFLRTKGEWKSAPEPLVAVGGGRSHTPGEGLGPDPDIARRLEEKKHQIREIEDDRRKQLSELKSQMAGLLGTYTPSYPPVMALQRKIDALVDEPGTLAALKSEERSLLTELASGAKAAAKGSQLARAPSASVGFSPAAPLARGPALPPSRQDLELVDPASAIALSRLESRIHKYEESMDQIGAAKLELDLARSAFRYRYSLHRPAEIPTAPKRPIRAILAIGGTLLALLLAVGVAALLDWAGGCFLHAAQVRRKLSLSVLGEVTRL
ncbi:MAG TPA: hypothetical protein VJT73_18450 [Polyangiaceae bacterium]|nr:hypothetical protein [Polyangiaceae bacterium]